jgi:site-specific DNA-methyltransferase (adenine-specific)
VPIKKTPKPKAQYREKPPRSAAPKPGEGGPDLPHAHPLEPRHFELRDDGTIESSEREQANVAPLDAARTAQRAVPTISSPNLIFSHDSPFVRLYHGDCFALLDAIAARHPEGRFDTIFADPPYFLSNGGITCHAGRMVKVDKGDWDKSRGPELNHEFNREWLSRCQRVLKPNGTIWVSGTHHVIFSIGYAMQQLGFKILNDIAWEKPNPPPNLSCRYFTHSTETILWAARDEKSKHIFNYDAMRAATGKQMKTVWRGLQGEDRGLTVEDGPRSDSTPSSILHPPTSSGNVWTLSAPGSDEKIHGKHPTQKPVALIARCLLASTNPGDIVLDPFLGGGTTAIAALSLNRGCVGIEADFVHITLATKRADYEIISIWLRHYRVSIEITVVGTPRCGVTARTAGGTYAVIGPNTAAVDVCDFQQIDLDLFSNSINGSRVDEKPQAQIPTERIFHETKFVFLSCAEVERGAVVHTTVDVSLQEAWAKTPNGKKRETTHIVRCETEILRIKS